jgi:hypothetical protein
MNSQIIAVPANEELKNCPAAQPVRRGVFIPQEVSNFLKNPNDARIFSQLIYWFLPSKTGGTKLKIYKQGQILGGKNAWGFAV